MSFTTRKRKPDPVDEAREAARVSVLPIESSCPACQAHPEEPCTAPTDTSRRPVRWFHHARVSLAREGGAP